MFSMGKIVSRVEGPTWGLVICSPLKNVFFFFPGLRFPALFQVDMSMWPYSLLWNMNLHPSHTLRLLNVLLHAHFLFWLTRNTVRRATVETAYWSLEKLPSTFILKWFWGGDMPHTLKNWNFHGLQEQAITFHGADLLHIWVPLFS